MFRILCTFLGESVVDMQRVLMYNSTYQTPGAVSFWHTMSVIEFADVLATSLLVHVKKVSGSRSGSSTMSTSSNNSLIGSVQSSLKRACIFQQLETTILTSCKKDLRLKDYEALDLYMGDSKKKSGKKLEANCFMCRKYTTHHVKTTFACISCNTPICLKNRASLTRGSSCIDEHLMSMDLQIKCDGNRKFKFPSSFILK